MKDVIVNAVIVGGHVNAQTIVKNLKEIGFDGRIILLRTPQESRGLAAFCNPDIEVWRVPLSVPSDLLSALRVRFEANEEKTAIFFTDERFHLAFSEGCLEDLPWLKVHFGAIAHVKTILDRQQFCQFLSDKKLADVPKTVDGGQDPFKVFGDQFILRPRYSWHDLSRHESVRLVSSQKEYDHWMADFQSRGIGREDVCYQELLSIRDEDNVSICGWYDKEKHYLICTRKVLQHPPKTGNGDVIERIEPPEGVMEAALRVLKALDYDGPFELEFVFDEQSNKHLVIELNPRFWMQHGLVEAVTGYALVSSYLNRDPLESVSGQTVPRYWINPLYAMFRLMRGDYRGVRYAYREGAHMPFSFFQAISFAPIHIVNKVMQRC